MKCFPKKVDMAYSVELKNYSFNPTKTKGVLNNISFKIAEGEYVALIGRNGEGKTSIIKAISGELEENIMGSVQVGLAEGADLIHKLGDVGIVHQFVQDDLIDSLSISKNIQIRQALSNDENVRRSAKFKNWDARINSLITKHLSTDDFAPPLNTIVSKLSGGQKQLLNVLIALKLEHSLDNICSLLLLDEHLTSLDIVIEKKVTELIDKLTIIRGERKTTIIMVTHDIDHALTTDRILVIKDGTVKTEILKSNKMEWNKSNVISQI